ncbi:SNF2 family N-terminal domain-containing protein [Hypoxylon sp. NC1633]|nr:SNF2 family N-terminal domain-containing protein [Hypoxylon sp. NC1633]
MAPPDLSVAPEMSGNRQKGRVRYQHVQLQEPFPDALLTFLEALPSENATEHAEPSTKRARIDHADRIESIPVDRASFTLMRPSNLRVPFNKEGTRPDADRYLKLSYNSIQHTLTMHSVDQTSSVGFKSEIDIGDWGNPKFTQKSFTILKVACLSREARDEAGALWVRIAVDLARTKIRDCIIISLELNWNSSMFPLRTSRQRGLSQPILDVLFRRQNQGQQGIDERLLPQAFYDAAYTPEIDQSKLWALPVPGLTSRLYPFQRRSLQWLLNREGVKWSDRCSDGEPGLEPFSPPATTNLPLSFSDAVDANGQLFYVSRLYHVITRDLSPFRRMEAAVKGGILAEEMGLGKTVEIISLICLHTRQDISDLNNFAPRNVRPSGATLIITPTSLKDQWVAELHKHAPHLKLMVYEGVKRHGGNEDHLIDQLAEHDVVITTYNVLQTEVHYVEEPPSRSMRHERVYHRPKSPLVQISWWRVCLDEAQQIESGVSGAAKVARLIPRVNSWGITGTPVKENIKDLWGLLLFLHYEPFASSTVIWQELITSHKQFFKPLFNQISLRHTKLDVREEVTLPPQKRYVISMPFTPVEEQHYQTQFAELARGLNLNTDGKPGHAGFDAEDPRTVDLMKRALAHLRQSILHPSLGFTRLSKLGFDPNKKPLRRLEDVLQAMLHHYQSQIHIEHMASLLLKIERGQVLEAKSQVEEAIKSWGKAESEAEDLEKEYRKNLQDETVTGEDPNLEEIQSDDSESGDGDKSDDEGSSGRVSASRRKLRTLLDYHHRAVFFIASGYYQIKTNVEKTLPNSREYETLGEKEEAGYEKAKSIRRELLQEPRSKALSRMAIIRDKMRTQSFVEIPVIELPSSQGSESRRILDIFQQLGKALDDQVDIINTWRESIIQSLLRPLVDEEDENDITGEEYQDSTTIQDELMVYTLALRAVIADRKSVISGVENQRVKYETRTAEIQARDGKGHAPEKLLALLQERQKIMQPCEHISVRDMIADIKELTTKLHNDAADGSHRAEVELEIVKEQGSSAHNLNTTQLKAITALEQELDSFTRAMNSRVEYYRQLQAVSDTVLPYDAENVDLDGQLERLAEHEQLLQVRMAQSQSKLRYLLHLRDNKTSQDREEICVICQSPFSHGILTTCGHLFCKDCLMFWFKMSRSCPVCKTHLSKNLIQEISLKKPEMRFQQEDAQESGDASTFTRSKSSGIYSQFSSEKLNAIKSVNLGGRSYSTKIDTLAKHLTWLQVEDPGAKSVIFSQFGGFLDILSEAFDQHGIPHTSFKSNNGITAFQEDPAIECLLIDARSHASGLNLVNARHVFLCEPLLNTALELQVIARIHRIGQQHETTVWLYLINGTVEESIYDLSVQRRLEHLGENTKGKSKESEAEVSDVHLEALNSLELQQHAALSKLMSKDQLLGEVIDKSDLWQCLFGHVAKYGAAEDDRANTYPIVMDDPTVLSFLAGRAA